MADCLALAEKNRQNSGVMFVVDTLEFLHRGGRIGGASRYLGTALKLKPLLTVEDGAIEALERVRTKHKAQARLVEMIVGRLGGKSNIHMASLHANAKEDARALMEQLKEQLEIVETVESEVSPFQEDQAKENAGNQTGNGPGSPPAMFVFICHFTNISDMYV